MMSPSGFLIDANLLILLIAGRTDPHIIDRHKRLKAYSARDYDILCEVIWRRGGIVYSLPNTLSEASNLVSQYGEPDRTELMRTLAQLIQESNEVIVLSTEAVAHPAYTRLGLADAAALQIVRSGLPVLTADVSLYHEAERQLPNRNVNFNDIRGPV